MKIRIRNKILLTICLLMVLSLGGQIVFNQFFSKEFYIRQQKNVIADAFDRIRLGYADNFDDIASIAQELQDTYGIKTVIFEGSEAVYSSGYSFMMKGQYPGIFPASHGMAFSTDPTVAYTEGIGPRSDSEQLQLAGKFSSGKTEVRVLLTLQLAAVDNSISVFTESSVYISLGVLLVRILLALVMSKTISRPITDIEAASRKIAVLDFSYIANESESTYELASLAGSINQMSRQLEQTMSELKTSNTELQKQLAYKEQLERSHREFIAAISHEMKTPLALLQIYAENRKI